tara:strand:- start:591 stop:1889 length:1299 start_codon:yes stop_codon:yes gene_type:complete
MDKTFKNPRVDRVMSERVPCVFAKPGKNGECGTHTVVVMLDSGGNVIHLTSECAHKHGDDSSEAVGALSKTTCSHFLAGAKELLCAAKVSPSNPWKDYSHRKGSAVQSALTMVRQQTTDKQSLRSKQAKKLNLIAKRSVRNTMSINDTTLPDLSKYYEEYISALSGSWEERQSLGARRREAVWKSASLSYCKALNSTLNKVTNSRVFSIVPIHRVGIEVMQDVVKCLLTHNVTSIPRAALVCPYIEDTLGESDRAVSPGELYGLLALRMSDGTWFSVYEKTGQSGRPFMHVGESSRPQWGTKQPVSGLVHVDGALFKLATDEELLPSSLCKMIHRGLAQRPHTVRGHNAESKKGFVHNWDRLTPRYACVVCRKEFKNVKTHLQSTKHAKAVNQLFLHGLKFTTKQGIHMIRKYGIKQAQYCANSMDEFLEAS